MSRAAGVGAAGSGPGICLATGLWRDQGRGPDTAQALYAKDGQRMRKPSALECSGHSKGV